MLRYIKSLDGLRGLAIILVFLFHLGHFSYGFFGLKFGWIGVQMFFVLSGYLITQILLKEKHKVFGQYIGKFYWRRVLRIFPIYFTYISFFAIVYLLTNHPRGFNAHAPFLFTYTYNFTRFINGFNADPFFIHLWSLSVEEQFYLIWPMCIFFLTPGGLRKFVLVLILGMPVLRYGLYDILVHSNLHPDRIGEAIYGFTLSHFDAFALGGAIPVFMLDKKPLPAKALFGISLGLVLLAGAVNLILMQREGLNPEWPSFGYPIGGIHNAQYVWSYTLLNGCFGALILCLVRKGYRGVFNNSWLVAIGKISYGMYLYHFAILMFFEWLYKRVPHNDFIFCLLSFGVTYFVSWVSYRFYEKKFLALKDRYFLKPAKSN